METHIKILLALSTLLLVSCGPTEEPTVDVGSNGKLTAAVTAIGGYVYDFNTGAALVGATVSTDPVSPAVLTGTGGLYQLDEDLVAGTTYEVRAEFAGYQTNFVSVTAEAGVLRTADIGLTPSELLLAVSPLTIDLGATQQQGSFSVSNDGSAGTELSWEVTTPSAWVVSVEPSSGVLAPEDPAVDVTVTVDRDVAGGDFGFLSGLATVASNGGVELVDLRIEVPEPDAPHLDYVYEVVDFGAADTQRGVTIENDGTGALTWSVEETLDWLAVAPTSGTLQPGANETLMLTADRTGLDAGSEHAGYLAFDSDTRIDDRLPLRVHLAVPHHYEWQVGPTTFDMGEDRIDGRLDIENLSSDTLGWTSASSDDWLRAVPEAGQIAVGDTAPAYVMIDRAVIPTGPFSGQVTFSSPGGDVVVSVSGENVPHPIYKNEAVRPIDYWGQPEPYASLYISNPGSGTLEWSVTSDTPWVTRIEPSSGSSEGPNCMANGGHCGDEVKIYADPTWFAAPEDADGRVFVEVAYSGEIVEVPFRFEFRDLYWEPLATPPEIGERHKGQMVYDPIRDRMVMFGGVMGDADQDRGDHTWEFDGTSWQQVVTATSPPARHGQQMVFDRRRGKVVMWSGFEGKEWGGELLDDTWEYDGSDWTLVVPSGSPMVGGAWWQSERMQVGLFDPVRGDILTFGRPDDSDWFGRDGYFAFYRYDGQGWTEQTSPGPLPDPRGARLVWVDDRPWMQIQHRTEPRADEAFVPNDEFLWEAVEPKLALRNLDAVTLYDRVNGWFFHAGHRISGTNWGIGWGSYVSVHTGPGLDGYFKELMTTAPPALWDCAAAMDTRRHRAVYAGCACEDFDYDEWESFPVACVDSWALYLDPPMEPRIDTSEAPVLAAAPTTLDFGTADDALTLTVENTGDGVLDWLAPPPTGFGVDPDWGEVGEGESVDLTVSVDRAALGVGVHSATLTIRSDGGDSDITLDVTVE